MLNHNIGKWKLSVLIMANMVATKKLFCVFWDKARIRNLNLNQVFTAYNACRKQKRKDEFILRLVPLLSYPRLMKLKQWISILLIYVLILFVHLAQVVSTYKKRILQSE